MVRAKKDQWGNRLDGKPPLRRRTGWRSWAPAKRPGWGESWTEGETPVEPAPVGTPGSSSATWD
eukprot:4707081-Alexandrium_andersonii.AAC.1